MGVLHQPASYRRRPVATSREDLLQVFGGSTRERRRIASVPSYYTADLTEQLTSYEQLRTNGRGKISRSDKSMAVPCSGACGARTRVAREVRGRWTLPVNA